MMLTLSLSQILQVNQVQISTQYVVKVLIGDNRGGGGWGLLRPYISGISSLLFTMNMGILFNIKEGLSI